MWTRTAACQEHDGRGERGDTRTRLTLSHASIMWLRRSSGNDTLLPYAKFFQALGEPELGFLLLCSA
jgi:hypothetical protein